MAAEKQKVKEQDENEAKTYLEQVADAIHKTAVVMQDGPAFDPSTVDPDKPWHYERGKLRGPLIMAPNACKEVARVFAYGAKKYVDVDGVPNWYHYSPDTPITDYAGSLERHFIEWLCLEDLDHETGLHHLAHLIANALMILEAHDRYIDTRRGA